jgi:hypothetical protein
MWQSDRAGTTPGDMQFLKDAVILHARTEYEDWSGPEKKRHLLRLWLTNFRFKDGDAQVREVCALQLAILQS